MGLIDSVKDAWNDTKKKAKRYREDPTAEHGDCPEGGPHTAYDPPHDEVLGHAMYQCVKCGRHFSAPTQEASSD